jgi:hypothetical protein
MPKSRNNLLAGVALAVGIATDQIIDPQAGLVGHMLVLLGAGGAAAFLLERGLRWRATRRATGTPDSRSPG